MDKQAAELDKTVQEFTDRQMDYNDRCHANVSSNLVYVEENKIPATSAYHASRTHNKAIALMYVPQLYWAISGTIREIRIRRMNKHRDKMIVCGIGNSLLRAENIFGIIEAAKCGWKIMAVDRARPQLMSYGLVPDYTVSLDGQEHVTQFFGSEDERFLPQKGEVIFLDFQVHPSVFKMVGDSEATMAAFSTGSFGACNAVLASEMKYGYITGVETVIVTPVAINEALRMNFKTIVTIGTELGWKDKESIEEAYRPIAYQMINGSWTIYAFEKAAKYFKDIAQVLDTSNAHHANVVKNYKPKILLDASGGIDKGYPYMPLKEILEKY